MAPMSGNARLFELASVFGRLGTVAFGGPAAHTALMREAVVVQKQWLTDREFLDLVAATNLIPGPNSTELAIHIGHRRAGWPGLLVAGAAFILPATLIVLTLAWAYVTYGTLPEVRHVFYGVAPVIIAVVGHALWGMARSAVTSARLFFIALVSVIALAWGLHELVVLAMAAVLGLLTRGGGRWFVASAGAVTFGSLRPQTVLATMAGVATAVTPVSLGGLFGVFLKIGAVLFGSGYVLLAFLRADFVDRLGWLTEAQLMDAIAIGQFTPGPLFTTATFVGYLLAGTPGAALATVGIFLPAFIYVATSAPIIPRLRTSPTLSALLDGVTMGSLALMAVVSWELGRASLVDATTAVLCAAALMLLLTTRVNSAALVVVGAIAGLLQL
jgi:chromate transporter